MIDTSGYDNHVSRFAGELMSRLERIARTFPFAIGVQIKQNITETGDEVFSSSKSTLSSRSGATREALEPGKRGNITRIIVDSEGISITYGIDRGVLPYPAIHEDPDLVEGFIKSKGKMHRYFFAKYAETGDDNYLFIALSVRKKGGVKVRRRRFFWKGVEQYVQKGLQPAATEIARTVELVWGRTRR